MKRSPLAAICVLFAVCLMFSGCSEYKQIEPEADDLRTVGTIGDKEVYFDQLRFAVYTCRDAMISTYGEGIFDGEDAPLYLEMLRKQVLASITADYATLALCEEYGIGLGEPTVLESVDGKLASLVEELGSMRKYKKYLKENHLTDRTLRFSTEISILQNELFYVYVDDLGIIENDDDKLYDLIKKEFIKVRHVFIPHSESDAMQTVTADLADGASFASLIEKYGSDGEMSADGIFILKGYMSEEYESVAFGLDVGEISDVVEDENGVYLIERLELIPTDIMLNFNRLKDLYQTYTFYSMIDQKQAELEFIPNDVGVSFLNDPF